MREGRGVALPGAGRAARAIDTHAHLNHPRLLGHLPEALSRATDAGVREIIVVGYDLPSSETAVRLAEEHSDLWAAVGVHPHDASDCDEKAVARLRGLGRSPAVVAIGETGLDFYRDLSPREAQVEAFRMHLSLAAQLELPAIVHCRASAGCQDAQEAVLEILSTVGASKLVWHCFDGSQEHAERALDLGMFLGFGGMVTYGNAEKLRQIAAEVPADRVLLETDCPYLSPEPRRGRDNEPANLPVIAARLAQLRGVALEEVAATAEANARRAFHLPEKAQ